MPSCQTKCIASQLISFLPADDDDEDEDEETTATATAAKMLMVNWLKCQQFPRGR
jgi:hypothetical protein